MGRIRRLGLAALVLTSLFAATHMNAARADAEIESAGPITRVMASSTLHCAANWIEDASPLFFSDTACGTYVAHAGTLYGPDNTPGSNGALGAVVPFTPVSQTLTGNGSAAHPFVITTVVDAGDALRVTRRDSYVKGKPFFTTSIQVANATSVAATPVVFHAADCLLQGSDAGLAVVDAATKTAGCRSSMNNTPGPRTLTLVPETPGAHYRAGVASSVWSAIGTQTNFTDGCDCGTEIDAGVGVSWGLSVAPGANAIVALRTAVASSTFSGVVDPAPTFVAPTPAYDAVVAVPTATAKTLTFKATDAAPSNGVQLTVEPSAALINVTVASTDGNPATATLKYTAPVAGDYPVVVRATDGHDETVTQFVIRASGKAMTTLEAFAAVLSLPQIGPKSLYLTVSAELRSVGLPVMGKQIVFYSGSGQELCRALTDGSGYASCKSVVSALQALSALDYEAKFYGDSLYLPSSSNGDIIRLLGLPLP